MIGKLLPVIFLIVGLALGGGAGLFLRPAPEPMPEGAEVAEEEETEEEEGAAVAFVKLNNQFVVPVVKKGRIAALVVLSISLETREDQTTVIYDHEPKIRDAFLSVLFDHSYGGGFDGAFTSSPNLEALRFSLLESTRAVVEDAVRDVLITDIVRQDT